MLFKLFISILLFSSHMIEEATELQKYIVVSFLKVCIIRHIAIPLQWRIIESAYIAFVLHGWTIFYEFHDKLHRDFVEAIQYLVGTVDKIGLVVSDIPFLTERSYQCVCLL